MFTQVMIEVIVVSVWNQPKTTAAPVLTVMYVRRPSDEVMRMHHSGMPLLVQYRSCFGAWPFCARAKRYLEPVYKKALADEDAEVRMTALMM